MNVSNKQTYTVGFLGNMAIVTAVLVFMYATTFNPENVNSFYVMALLIALGLPLAVWSVGLRFSLDKKRLFESLLWGVLSCLMILLVNQVAPVRLGLNPVNEFLFSVLAGVAEEVFFRLWLCASIHKITHSTILAIGVSSFAWSIYHIHRYGASMNVLVIIFLAGCVLGWILLQSRMGDGPIIGHMAVNGVASSAKVAMGASGQILAAVWVMVVNALASM